MSENRYYENHPNMVLLEITTRCNLTCSYCAARKLVKHPEDLPLDKIIALSNSLAPFDYVCLCGLGETMLHKNIYEILEVFKDKKVIIVTNGSVPIDYEKLVQYGNVDAVSFSIDGSTEEEMKNISSNYRFDILLQNLTNAVTYGINTAINCTMIPENIARLEALKDFAIQYQVKRFKIGFPLGQSKWIKTNVDVITKVLEKIQSGLEEAGIVFEGPMAVKCIFDNAPIVVVSKNGNVYPCCDYFCQRPLVGNLFHQDFLTMWEKESYQQFRTGKYCSKCTQYHNLPSIGKLFGL